MANVFYAGAGGFDALLYPDQHPNTMAYVEQQFSAFSNTLTETGKVFMEQAKSAYDQIMNSDAILYAKAAIRKATGLLNNDVIRPLESLEDAYSATPLMQRWIMTEPSLRKLHVDQRCEGFSETYVDTDPGKYGILQRDYRLAMSEVVQDDDDAAFAVDYYMEELQPGEKELSHIDKVTIQGIWAFVECAVAQGKDPSSPTGNDL